MTSMDDVDRELTEYADLDGTEWGETASALLRLWQMRTLLSEEFLSALEKEIREWLEHVKENTTITEHEQTHTYKVKELEWM